MNTRASKRHVFGAGLAALAIGAVAIAPGAVAADESGNVDVVNTETVQVYINAEGEIERQSVYEQLSFTGDGTVEVANPVETDGLRNLDGFGGVSAEDGVQDVTMTVDGYERLRSVSDYTGDLPLEFDITYLLDGEEIEPGDLLGESGELEVVYTVRNVTAQPQEVSFPDGQGGTATETVDVPIPIVGSMTATVPPNFTDVTSEQANIAGDGKGGTKLSFTMTLFPPLGSDEMEFSYQAQVSDAIVPATSVTALPVNPLEVPTFKTAGESYQSGSDTGIRLAEGATLIDENLLKLRDGAAQLLDGLIQLSDGGDQLAAGLAGEAAPGAQELADGLGQIDDGAGQLSDGATQLADGQAKLADGLATLYDGVDELPASVKQALKKNKDYLSLLGALTSIADGIGNYDDVNTEKTKTLLGGINDIQRGLKYGDGNDCLSASLAGVEPEKCGAVDALQAMSTLIGITANVDVQRLDATLNSEGEVQTPGPLRILWSDNGCAGELAFPLPGNLAGDCAQIAQVYSALFKPKADNESILQAGVKPKLLEAQVKLGDVVDGIETRLLDEGAGLDLLRVNLSNPNALADCAKAKGTATTRDDCGIKQAALFLRDSGIPSLVDGITANVRTQLIEGIGVPTAGCDPTSTLRCAAAALADGGGQLSDGAQQLADGTGQASDGAGQLAEGLGTAADGSERLADGLSQAEEGAPKLVDGAGRLSTEGMSQLIEAGEDTAQDYGKLYATIKAGADRADAEKMAYGAPEGAQGLTAYSYELLGDDGQGSRNTKRGVAALALLGVGAGGLLLRRRLL